MPVASSFLSRPVLSVGLSTLLVGVLALSGCSSPPKAVSKPAVSKTTAVVVVKPDPFKATGIPADLAAVIKPLYLGGIVRSSPSASSPLTGRKIVKAKGPVVVKGFVATWKGERIAVVTHGKDVTLAVRAPKWTVVGGWWPSMGVSAPSLGGVPRRVLMVGSDARPGQSSNNARGDSLHIVGLDGHGGGGVLGIPRDSYVPLASGGKGKINSALTYGGPVGLQHTVSSVTGVQLEGYLLTGFDGFYQLVQGFGGLPVDIPVAVKDDLSGANVKAGENLLGGGMALAYGRARHAVVGGDFGRSSNQGLLILAAGLAARHMGPEKLPRILEVAAPHIDTNLTAEQVLTFAAGVFVTKPEKIKNRVATGGAGWTADRQSIVLLDANARNLFADMRDGNLS
ncbi:MAG: LCP family protein [Actinomycetota bacterium]